MAPPPPVYPLNGPRRRVDGSRMWSPHGTGHERQNGYLPRRASPAGPWHFAGVHSVLPAAGKSLSAASPITATAGGRFFYASTDGPNLTAAAGTFFTHASGGRNE